MNTTFTNVDAPSTTNENLFVPMTEAQMAKAKGGDDWPDWLDDLIQQFDDLLDYLEEILISGPEDLIEGDWDDLEDDLAEEGYIPFTPEEIGQDW